MDAETNHQGSTKMQERKDTVWKAPEIVEGYLQQTRGAVPMLEQEFDLIRRLIRSFGLGVQSFLESVWDECTIDFRHQAQIRAGNEISREKAAEIYYTRPDREANILALVEDQCQWLRAIGFEDVDCFFKFLEIAIFGGRRSTFGR